MKRTEEQRGPHENERKIVEEEATRMQNLDADSGRR